MSEATTSTGARRSEPDGITHGEATVNGVRLHYVEAGARTAPTLVLLHGFPQSWLIWRHVLPLLAAHYHIVAPDLRGYGASAKPAGREGYDKATMAADIAALLQTLHVERALLIGHDRGARVARRFALDFPAMAAAIALLDIVPVEWIYDTLPAPQLAQKYWHWLFHLVPDLPERLITDREVEYMEAIYSRSPGYVAQIRAEGAWDAYIAAFQGPGGVAGALNDYRATYAVDVPRYRAERAAGVRVRVPTLLLWGERGNMAGQPVEAIWREVIDDVRGFQVADCGHYLAEEQPAVTADHLLRFAAEVFGAR